ncbi:MAG: phosphoenolpyruvate--protein phosphotransferase [Lysobacterales bacterium CG02_land_8_20_14_3_00_62_12]|nr:MAG: phosphoenolpyruvate--protein phosphotransferase [Xanthomonadales bacterium CG02_land_8_20_14_3_00_62_12]
MRSQWQGSKASGGLSLGRARVVYSANLEIEADLIDDAAIPNETKRFEAALNTTRQELQSLSERLSGALARDLVEIIEAHALILDDPDFTDGVVALIRAEHLHATAALKRQRDQLAAAFDAIEDPYLRARRDDLDHVVQRVFAALQRGGAEPDRRVRADGEILVCESLPPAELAQLQYQGLHGVVATASSPYSHTAILARSFRMPMVCGVKGALAQIHDGDLILLDADHGSLIVQPDAIDLTRFRSQQKEIERTERRRSRQKAGVAKTRDGYVIRLHANADDAETIVLAARAGADSIGLFRTEFLFMRRRELPSEEEQFRVYRDAVISMGNKPVTLRTLDLGADKTVGGPLEISQEENPALGLRGIRLSLQRSALFATQLRAMLRASAFGSVRILLPMVSAVEEVRAARSLLESCMAELRASKVPMSDQVPLGVMIEVPAAVMICNELARIADFFAIGSNDLAQYVLAADRNNAAVVNHYDPLHPAFIRTLFLVFDGAHRARCPISICGEIAGDPLYTPLLIALGLTDFSMHPNSIRDVRDMLATLNRKSLRAKAKRFLHAADRESLCALMEN